MTLEQLLDGQIGDGPVQFEDSENLRLWFSEQVDELLSKYDDSLAQNDVVLGEEDKATEVKAYCSRMGLKSMRDWLKKQN